MRESEIRHVNEGDTKAPNGRELRFTHYIDPATGALVAYETKTTYYDNVVLVSGSIFMAWDNADPSDVVLFMGEYIDENQTKESK